MNTNNPSARRPVFILIGGHIGSGKSSVARIIRQLCPGFVVRNFAGRLKHVVAAMAGVPIEVCLSHEGKNQYVPAFGRTIGQLLQEVGMDFRNRYHRDVWVDLLFEQMKSEFANDPSIRGFIIDDMRFPNEADRGEAEGGRLLRMEGDPCNLRTETKRDLNHPSETALDQRSRWDALIVNGSPDLGALEMRVRQVLQEWGILPQPTVGNASV